MESSAAISLIDQILAAGVGAGGTLTVGGIGWYILRLLKEYLNKKKPDESQLLVQPCHFDIETKERVHKILETVELKTPDGVSNILSHQITTKSIAKTQGTQTEILAGLAKTADAISITLEAIEKKLGD